MSYVLYIFAPSTAKDFFITWNQFDSGSWFFLIIFSVP